MEIDEFLNVLRPMLKNPNAIDGHDGVIYIYTDDGKLISFSVGF
jgi:hypothetical protein